MNLLHVGAPALPSPSGAAGAHLDSSWHASPLLPRVRNGELPLTLATAPGPAATGANWRRLLVGVTTLALLGSVAYWSFGRPIFLSQAQADQAKPTASPGSIVDWARVDAVLRKSIG